MTERPARPETSIRSTSSSITSWHGGRRAAVGLRLACGHPAEARQLIDAIDTATVIGLRDRALVGL
jgi:hypothetical protein